MAYLASLVNVGIKMIPEDPMPFFLVRRITGGDDMVTDFPVVSIHTFDSDIESCEDAAFRCHDLMKALTAKTTITFGGADHSIDKIEVVETPKWVDYANDNLERYVARYRIHLRI